MSSHSLKDLSEPCAEVSMFQGNWYCKTPHAGIATEIEIAKHPSLVLEYCYSYCKTLDADIVIGVVIAKHPQAGEIEIDVAIAKQPQPILFLVLVLQKLSP